MFVVLLRCVLLGFILSFGISLLFVCLILLLLFFVLVMQFFEMSWVQYWEVIINLQVVVVYKVMLLLVFVVLIFNGVFGLLMVWILICYCFLGCMLFDVLMDLFFVLLTVVVGLMLVLFFFVNGFYGEWLVKFDIKVIYIWLGIVVVMVFISILFVVCIVQLVLEELGLEYEEVVEMFGVMCWQSFCKVVLLEFFLVLVVGVVLLFICSFGEFGVVIFIVGNIVWKTEVMLLMIFVCLQEFDYLVVSVIVLVIFVVFLILLFLINIL